MSLKVVEFKKKPSADKITPNDVLEGAKDQLDVVVVLGVGTDGYPYFQPSTTDKATVILMLEQLKFDLLAGVFDDEGANENLH